MEFVRKHIHAIIGAILYLIMVIVILLLLGFTTPLPLPEEQGILLDFGGSGSRDISGSAPATTSDQQNASSQSSASTGVITQDYEPTASLPSSNTPSTSNNVSDNTSTTETTTDQSSTDANRITDMMSGAFGGGSGSGSSGTGSGNPGMGDGSSGGSGGGPGGIGGSLEGRRLVHRVEPESRPNMVGTVVLRITVSENGDVTNVTLVRTTCSECVELATRAVRQWRYASSPGSGYQTGEVHINFRQQ